MRAMARIFICKNCKKIDFCDSRKNMQKPNSNRFSDSEFNRQLYCFTHTNRTFNIIYRKPNIKKGVEKMTNQNMPSVSTAEKFQNAEQLWFWFLYSKSMQNGFMHNPVNATRRVCQVLDVETLITKLYLSGKLTDEQLAVMKKFGDRRRAPHQYIWAENRASGLWRDAMNVLDIECTNRGWIEK